MSSALATRSRRDVGWAYLLWLGAAVGVSGLHRFYAGRHLSGLLWLVTGGLCGIGHLIDLLFIPNMVDDYNSGRRVW